MSNVHCYNYIRWCNNSVVHPPHLYNHVFCHKLYRKWYMNHLCIENLLSGHKCLGAILKKKGTWSQIAGQIALHECFKEKMFLSYRTVLATCDVFPVKKNNKISNNFFFFTNIIPPSPPKQNHLQRQQQRQDHWINVRNIPKSENNKSRTILTSGYFVCLLLTFNNYLNLDFSPFQGDREMVHWEQMA